MNSVAPCAPAQRARALRELGGEARACSEPPAVGLHRRPRPVGGQLERAGRVRRAAAASRRAAAPAPRPAASRAASAAKSAYWTGSSRQRGGAARRTRPRTAPPAPAVSTADRPAVGDDVVQGEEQDVLVRGAEPQQRGAQQRPAREIEGPAALFRGRQAARLRPCSAPAEPPGRSARSDSGAGGPDDLRPARRRRLGKTVRSASWRRTISPSACVQSAPRRARPRGAAPRACCRRPRPARAGPGTRAAAARRRAAAVACSRGTRQDRAAPRSGARRPPGSSDPPGQARHGGRLEQVAQRQLDRRSAWRSRDITRVASSEWPPSSKKSSWTPTSLHAEHLAPRSPPDRSSVGVAGRDVALSAARARPSGAGRARRSTLPLAVRGKRSRTHEGGGHHVVGQRALQSAAQLAAMPAAPSAPRGTTYATSRVSPGASSRTSTTRSPHRRVRPERRLDLAQLDAEAAHLDLVVDPAQELQRSVPRRRTRSPVRYSRPPAARAERIGHEPSPPSAPAGPGSRAPARPRR